MHSCAKGAQYAQCAQCAHNCILECTFVHTTQKGNTKVHDVHNVHRGAKSAQCAQCAQYVKIRAHLYLDV
jgi:hypothetical protein